jgi:probable phosphoglycerate mutase
MRDIWLIRHAESLANAGATTSTPREIPLSPVGFEQAEHLSERLHEPPDLIVVSPYIRSLQTAQPFIENFPDTPVVSMEVQEFTYLAVSRCRGTSYEQRKPLVAEFWKRADPNYSDGDQAESFAEFIARTTRFVEDLKDRSFELAFVFTHEQFIKALIWNAMRFVTEISPDTMAAFEQFALSFQISNASVLRGLLDDDGSLYFGPIDRG